MDYYKTAKQILDLIGGGDNIETAAHCATRLRLVIKDDKKVKREALENVAEVKGVFENGGELQIIIGQGAVNKLYKEFVAIANIGTCNLGDSKKAAMKKMNPLQRFARMLSNIFVPIIPAIVASGLLMGLLGMSKTFGWINGESGAFILLDILSNAAFVFLPILIAFSASKEFGANPYLAAALGGILIHPAMQNAWSLGDGVKKSIYVFGLNIDMIGYQGTVLPILIAVWVMGYIERGLREIVPNVLDIIVTPFLTLMFTSVVSLVIIGPMGRLLGDGISFGLQFLYNTTGLFAGLVFGGLYSTIVITGIHHSFHAVEAGLLSNPAIAINFLLPIWSMANVAQGGAAIAVFFKTKNEKLKSIAVPAAASCLLGITEAAIFGINLRLVKPFIAAAIGGALGGAYVVATKVGMTAVGVTGIPGIAIVRQGSIVHYLIGLTIAFASAFLMTFLLGFKDKVQTEDEEAENSQVAIDERKSKLENTVIYAPMKGKVIPLAEVPDKTFSSGCLGNGVGIVPEEGIVVSPVNASVFQVFDTQHAIGLVTDTGVELIIHVGLDTIKMKGEGFNAFVKNGDLVRVGDKLLEFNLEMIKEKGFSTVTPIIVTNTDKFKNVIVEKVHEVTFKDSIISVEI